MTPDEKAKELHEKMFANCRITMSGAYHIFRDLAKGLAIIAVDEVIKVCPYIDANKRDSVLQMRSSDDNFVSYWEQVKEEINKL